MLLNDICSAIVDCEHRTAPVSPGGGFFAVGTPAMRQNQIDYSEAREISHETYSAWTQRMTPKPGDLLFAREAPVGPVVSIPARLNVAPGQRTVLLRPDPNHVVSRFLYYKLIDPRVQRGIQDLAMGSTVPHLNVADIRRLDVPLPSLAEQQAIAEVLGALDDKIAANSNLVTLIEDGLRVLFELRIKTGPNRPITEFVELNPRRGAPSGTAPQIAMQQLPSPGLAMSKPDLATPAGGTRFINGDTLLARITPCLENGKTGYVMCLDPGQIGFGSTEYIVLRSHDGLPLPLSYFIATDETFRLEAIQRMVGSSGRQRVRATDLTDLTMPLTDEPAAIQVFGAAAGPQSDLAQSLSNESLKLSELRDTLLPALIDGSLRVKEAVAQVEKVL